jgi:hypothetical protein
VKNHRPLRSSCLWISLLLLFGLANSRGTKAADISTAPIAGVGQDPRSAIADLDGDFLPDTASVQAGLSTGSMSTYWIRVHVAAGLRSFPLVAPALGLVIKARTVNGRNAADLVLATAWSKRPVAVFRNDGHGNFSRAEPTPPGSFNDSKSRLHSSKDPATSTAGVPPQSRTSICVEERELRNELSPSELIPSSNPGFPVSPFSVAHSGRAPPSAIPYLIT